MKRIIEIGSFQAGDSRLKVLDPTNLEVTVHESDAVFPDRTTVASVIAGRTASDWYQISRTYLKQHSQWRLLESLRERFGQAKTRGATHVRSDA
jgi:hypothetical protein